MNVVLKYKIKLFTHRANECISKHLYSMKVTVVLLCEKTKNKNSFV